MAKVFTLNKNIDSYKNTLLLLLFYSLITSYLLFTPSQINIPVVQAHLEHLPHYNSGGSRYGFGDYISFMALEPEYGTTDYPTQITFSIQDFSNNDVYNLMTMVEIYDYISGKRIQVFPWTFREVGDFDLYYQFPKKGSYQIVLSIVAADAAASKSDNSYEKSSYLSSTISPPRSILGDVSDCDCTRTVFNISIASWFGDIQNTLLFISIISPITLLGIILTKNYFKKYRGIRRGGGASYSTSHGLDVSSGYNDSHSTIISSARKEIIKYSVMLLALAGGIVHLVVFPEHGSLHIYYSIFLLSAAGTQVAYGVLYFLIMLSKPFYEVPIQQQQVIKSTYRENMAVNLFGFIGTAVLVGLYIYSVVYPPPLSPTNEPEEIEITGILAKSLEIVLLIGIAFIIRWDKQALQHIMIKINKY